MTHRYHGSVFYVNGKVGKSLHSRTSLFGYREDVRNTPSSSTGGVTSDSECVHLDMCVQSCLLKRL